MFRAVYSNPLALVPASNSMSAGPPPMPLGQPYSSCAQVMQGYPVALSGGRAVYCVPAMNEGSLQQVSYFPPAAQCWSSTSTASSAQPAAEAYSSVLFAPCTSSANVSASGSPTLLQPILSAPTFSTDKQLPPPISSHPSSTLSRMTRDVSFSGEATTALDASTTSVTSSNVGSSAAAGTATVANGTMASMGVSSALPCFQMALPLSAGTMTAVAASPQQPQACFWVNHATGALTPMRAEDMVAIGETSASTCMHSYAVPPPPPVTSPSTSASTSATSVSPYLTAAQVSSFGGAMMPSFSPSLSGSTAFVLPALPPPPPPPAKILNGLQYQLGELYEGVVKRYNPNRGFGFLTATSHITVSNDNTAGSANGPSPVSSSPAASPVSGTAEAEAPKEHHTPVHLGDIFVHQSSMHMEGFRTLPVGGRVRFRIGYKDGQQTLHAVDVELLPQVLPPNLEVASTAMSKQEAEIAGLGEAIGSTTSMPRAAQPATCVSEKASKGLPSDAYAINCTPSDVDDEKGDEPLIELAYDMCSCCD
ncbi:hypothetical protein LSCM1_01436 [Leishmania martiniquensis]|uniref:CSD domain-containing protein n=1 Tax=Leishmania martiniquensis TaxID=1580590 RepID=A0A836KG07_9TRYP|nr:hypothetical protein LSCM1_01436 [Leishmania martiniquensis]